jgi:hypothetical protein
MSSVIVSFVNGCSLVQFKDLTCQIPLGVGFIIHPNGIEIVRQEQQQLHHEEQKVEEEKQYLEKHRQDQQTKIIEKFNSLSTIYGSKLGKNLVSIGHGYRTHLSDESRHEALDECLLINGVDDVLLKLYALKQWNSQRGLDTQNIENDYDYVYKYYL